MTTFKPEAVHTIAGKPVMGFVIHKDHLPELERQIQIFSKGEHLLALTEEGDQLRVALFLYNPNPPKDVVDGIQSSVEKLVADKSSIQAYASVDYEPSSISFGKP